MSADVPLAKTDSTGTVGVSGKDKLKVLEDQLDSVYKEMATKEDVELSIARLREDLTQHPRKVREIECEAEKVLPNWDEWKKLERDCKSFDKCKAQFILIAGEVPKLEAQHIGLLRKVKWHVVIDLDPNSEFSGLHKEFAQDGQQSHLDTWAPGKVLNMKSSELAEAIKGLRLPWLFAKGRNSDTVANEPRKSFKEWTAKWMGPITRFLIVVAERLDDLMPVVTILLPFDGASNEYMTELLTRWDQELSSREPTSAKHIILRTGTRATTDEVTMHRNVSCPTKRYQLPSSLFGFGLGVCLGCAPKNAKLMPSAVKGADVPVTESDFLYLSEFLTLLYKGCENEQLGQNPDAIDDQRRNELIEEHKRAFLSGQTISFITLNHNHDATRDALQDFRSNIQRYMDQRLKPPSTVIELVHQPGTGGSTLARRTLWELRLQFPCAIVKSELEVHTSEEEDAFTLDICERILALEELCYIGPLVLIDGEYPVFRRSVLSRTIADHLRSQGSKAVILYCLRRNRATEGDVELSPYSIVLDTKLSVDEKERFREKYGQSTTGDEAAQLSRTFHFPLCAFVEEFKERMEDIVARTLTGLSKTETEVIRFVALMQVFAEQSVPMSLILKLFLDEGQIRRRLSYSADNEVDLKEHHLAWSPSYEDIYNSFSDSLRVLLVRSWTPGMHIEAGCVTCDLQHVIVAKCVLKKLLGDETTYYQLLEQYLIELLSEDKLKHIGQKYVALFENLFLFNKDFSNPKVSFSVLIELLKERLPPNERVGRLLERAASVFPSAKFYSQVARYFVYSRPHKFDLAEKMIAAGFGTLKPRESNTILHEMRGLVGRIQLADLVENGKVASIEELERLASRAIREYKLAITSPPSRPSPFLGIVQIWTKCMEWIIKNKCDGVADVIVYLGTEAPEFFRHILSEGFDHLDTVDQLLATRTVTDVNYSRDTVTDCRMKLCFLQSKSRGRAHGGRVSCRHPHLVAECEKLSKDPEFARCSQRELRRLKVFYFLHNDFYGLNLEALKQADIKYLYRLLWELVSLDKEYLFTSKLIRVAICLPPQHTLLLDDALNFVQSWQAFSPSDPYAHFYSFVLCFLKVLEGGAVDYGAKYEKSLQKCKDLSSSYINRTNSIFYLGKRGSGLTALVDKSTFKIFPNDDFWKQKSRETLLEVQGRVRRKAIKGRRKFMPNPGIYLEMKTGIRVDVGRNQMQLAGDLDRDYRADQLVKFVVSFCLRGPTAHGFVV